MNTFEISINGQKKVAVGLHAPGVMSLILHEVCRDGKCDLKLECGGLESREPRKHISWPSLELRTGDNIQIRISSEGQRDPPDNVEIEDSEKVAAQKSKYAQRLQPESSDQE